MWVPLSSRKQQYIHKIFYAIIIPIRIDVTLSVFLSIFLPENDLRNTIITIIAVIATAKVMGYSGMTSDIARTAVEATGMMYPAIAPLIGSVGTFITGSGTSSNVLFGNLQTDAAAAINANKAWLAAANAAGTCAGKMISPQNIATGVSTTALKGKEGVVFARTFNVQAARTEAVRKIQAGDQVAGACGHGGGFV